jgi:hypothetical protein
MAGAGLFGNQNPRNGMPQLGPSRCTHPSTGTDSGVAATTIDMVDNMSSLPSCASDDVVRVPMRPSLIISVGY